MFLSRGTGFTADPLPRTQSSRLTARDRPRGVRDVETGVTSMGTMSSMITESIVTVDVECPRLPRGAGRMCLASRMTGALIVVGEGFQSTPEGQALMRDPFSSRVWSTGTGLTEKVTTEMHLPAAEYMFRGHSALVEPSGPL